MSCAYIFLLYNRYSFTVLFSSSALLGFYFVSTTLSRSTYTKPTPIRIHSPKTSTQHPSTHPLLLPPTPRSSPGPTLEPSPPSQTTSSSARARSTVWVAKDSSTGAPWTATAKSQIARARNSASAHPPKRSTSDVLIAQASGTKKKGRDC